MQARRALFPEPIPSEHILEIKKKLLMRVNLKFFSNLFNDDNIKKCLCLYYTSDCSLDNEKKKDDNHNNSKFFKKYNDDISYPKRPGISNH